MGGGEGEGTEDRGLWERKGYAKAQVCDGRGCAGQDGVCRRQVNRDKRMRGLEHVRKGLDGGGEWDVIMLANDC